MLGIGQRLAQEEAGVSSFFMPLSFSAEAASFVVPPISCLDTSKANHA